MTLAETMAPTAPTEDGSEWLETVAGREYQVRYARPGGGQWVGTWVTPDGIPVTTYALTLELCQVRLRLEIAARTGVGA